MLYLRYSLWGNPMGEDKIFTLLWLWWMESNHLFSCATSELTGGILQPSYSTPEYFGHFTSDRWMCFGWVVSHHRSSCLRVAPVLHYYALSRDWRIPLYYTQWRLESGSNRQLPAWQAGALTCWTIEPYDQPMTQDRWLHGLVFDRLYVSVRTWDSILFNTP